MYVMACGGVAEYTDSLFVSQPEQVRPHVDKHIAHVCVLAVDQALNPKAVSGARQTSSPEIQDCAWRQH